MLSVLTFLGSSYNFDVFHISIKLYAAITSPIFPLALGLQST